MSKKFGHAMQCIICQEAADVNCIRCSCTTCTACHDTWNGSCPQCRLDNWAVHRLDIPADVEALTTPLHPVEPLKETVDLTGDDLTFLRYFEII